MCTYVCLYVPFDKIFKIKNNVKRLRKYIQYNNKYFKDTSDDHLFPFYQYSIDWFFYTGVIHVLFFHQNHTVIHIHLYLIKK